MPGSRLTEKRLRSHAAIADRSSGSPAASGYGDTGSASTASTSARRMNAGVSSRGSPTPKSIRRTPRASAPGACLGEMGERVGAELVEQRAELQDAHHALANASRIS